MYPVTAPPKMCLFPSKGIYFPYFPFLPLSLLKAYTVYEFEAWAWVAGVSICEAFVDRKSNREKLVWVSKHHPMVYWNAGERLVCDVMSCHPAPPIPTEAHCLIGPGLMMGHFHGLRRMKL